MISNITDQLLDALNGAVGRLEEMGLDTWVAYQDESGQPVTVLEGVTQVTASCATKADYPKDFATVSPFVSVSRTIDPAMANWASVNQIAIGLALYTSELTLAMQGAMLQATAQTRVQGGSGARWDMKPHRYCPSQDGARPGIWFVERVLGYSVKRIQYTDQYGAENISHMITYKVYDTEYPDKTRTVMEWHPGFPTKMVEEMSQYTEDNPRLYAADELVFACWGFTGERYSAQHRNAKVRGRYRPVLLGLARTPEFPIPTVPLEDEFEAPEADGDDG